MKNLTIIYSGEDGEAAQELADKIRAEHTDNKVQLHSTEYFFGAEVKAERVIIMPDVPFFRAMPIKEAYPKAEYTPPDGFSLRDIKKVFDAMDTPEAEASRQEMIKQFNTAVVIALNDEIITSLNDAPPKRPRGRPRKVAA